jgi:Zn finger protein HypA/HybF involved in hydrogenase expression
MDRLRAMEQDSKKITFTCEHCNEPVEYEFLTPIAVRCDHCDSVFDARLQLVKQSREKHGHDSSGD